MREIIHIETHRREVLVDITPQVESVVEQSGIRNGLVSVYAQGATAAIMIQENWDDSVQTDVVNLERDRRDIVQNFKQAIGDHPRILQAFYTTGDSDFVLLVVSRSLADYEEFTQSFFWENPPNQGPGEG
jgi:secondary thiamine-phosphate synthase enzyme